MMLLMIIFFEGSYPPHHCVEDIDHDEAVAHEEALERASSLGDRRLGVVMKEI